MYRFDREALKTQRSGAFVERRAIRFQDIDAAGIIFYPRVFEMFHDAYAAFLASAGTPLPEVVREGKWIAPVRHAEADYFKPLRFGDEITLEIVRAHVQPTEVTLGFRIARVSNGELCVVGQVVHTFVELAGFTRMPIPETIRRALLVLEGTNSDG